MSVWDERAPHRNECLLSFGIDFQDVDCQGGRHPASSAKLCIGTVHRMILIDVDPAGDPDRVPTALGNILDVASRLNNSTSSVVGFPKEAGAPVI